MLTVKTSWNGHDYGCQETYSRYLKYLLSPLSYRLELSYPSNQSSS